MYWTDHPTNNSIAIIVKHLAGNMLSRWTDFLRTDGEKADRNRDQEFEIQQQDRQALLDQWETGWKCLFEALDSLTEQQLTTIIYIRHQGHTVLEAINRQLAHYPYHIGQIVYIGRMFRKDQWTSLSIPKGQSTSYNAEKFAQDKQRQHYTDEYLKPKQ